MKWLVFGVLVLNCIADVARVLSDDDPEDRAASLIFLVCSALAACWVWTR